MFHASFLVGQAGGAVMALKQVVTAKLDKVGLLVSVLTRQHPIDRRLQVVIGQALGNTAKVLKSLYVP